ncbi:hypothetical protein QM027_04570 [Campylobacter concisus]
MLSVVISRPTATRTILDAGAKALTKERRSEGFCTTPGMGLIAEHEVWIDSLFDEHAIILNEKFANSVRVGDLVRIYPNHICPGGKFIRLRLSRKWRRGLRESACFGKGQDRVKFS